MELDQELYTIRTSDMIVHAYCQRIKAIVDLLANIDQPIPKKTLVTYMVNGLGEKFDQLARIICHQDPLPLFFKSRSMLIREELRLSRIQPQYGVTGTMLQPQLFFLPALGTLLVLLLIRPMVNAGIKSTESKVTTRGPLPSSQASISSTSVFFVQSYNVAPTARASWE